MATMKYLGTVDEVIHNGSTEPLQSIFRSGRITDRPAIETKGASENNFDCFASSFPYIVVSSDFAQYMGATVKTTNKTLIPI